MAFRDVEIFHDSVHERFQYDPHGLAKCDIFHFIQKTEEQLTDGFIILILPFGNGQHHIPCENNSNMCIQGIIGDTPALFGQFQV